MARRIMSMKNSNDTIRNRTCDLLACSTVCKPTIPLCATMVNNVVLNYRVILSNFKLLSVPLSH